MSQAPHMRKRRALACSLAALLAGSCAHTASTRLVAAEPLECEIIGQLAARTGGPIVETARPPLPVDWIAGYETTVSDAKAKRRPAMLSSCPALRPRLGPHGTEYGRVALNDDATRAVVEVDCGPWMLRRNRQGEPWTIDTTYVNAHGCSDFSYIAPPKRR